MNDYSSLRKQNTTRLGTAGVLLVCVLLSGSILFSRLVGFVSMTNRHYIPLTRSGGLTTVSTAAASSGSSRPRVLLSQTGANPRFQTSDKTTVWNGETNIEIFRVSYENGEGRATVNSTSGDKLLAPGTENIYEFALENTGNVPLGYTMKMEAYFSHGEYQIPIYAHLTDHQGNYLVGTQAQAAPVLELNGVSQSGTIDVGYVMPFTLHWEWPFDLDDAYDTMLGNLAVEEDITLTIVIHTTASFTDDPNPGGVPETGDGGELVILICMMLGSLAGMIILLLTGNRKKEEPNG